MKKLLMLLADGVEECEALVTRDVLLRGKIDVTMMSIMNRKVVQSQNGLLINCDTDKLVNLDEFDGVILPGGGRGTQNLDHYPLMDEILAHFYNKHQLLCAICAAPMVLGHRQYLKGKNFTCFKGCEEGLDGNYTFKEVEVDDNIITSRSMYFAQEFALAIIEKLFGSSVKEQVSRSIRSF